MGERLAKSCAEADDKKAEKKKKIENLGDSHRPAPTPVVSGTHCPGLIFIYLFIRNN